jgi:hypothetical protein
MTIDIDTLTEAELIAFNNRIVARLRFLQEGRAHAAMLAFRVGERVAFQPAGQPLLTGVITKYNRKTVTVLTEHGQHWNVAPTFLRTVPPAEDTSRPTTAPVIRLPTKPRKGHRA